MKGAARKAARLAPSRARSERNRRASGRRARATPWRSRSGCSARSSARSSPSRPARRVFELVERLRQAAIALRRDDDPALRGRVEAELDGLDLGAIEAVISAFSLYFQLVNLAEARGRVRALRRRERAARDGLLEDSVAEAIARLRRAGRDDARARRHPRPAAHHAGAHRPSDGGAPADGAHRPASLRRAPRAAGRPAPDAVRGPRGPAAPARGDHAPVADGGPALGRAGAARRGPHGDGRVRCDAVHARAPAVSRDRCGARRTGWEGAADRHATAARARRSCASARGSAATATGTRP